jgi:hypothetical protein
MLIAKGGLIKIVALILGPGEMERGAATDPSEYGNESEDTSFRH